MIIVYALKECNKCHELLHKLNKTNIAFKVKYDDEHEKDFDKLENIVLTTKYPIIEINHNDNIFGLTDTYSYIVSKDSTSQAPYIIKYKDIDHAIKLLKTIIHNI